MRAITPAIGVRAHSCYRSESVERVGGENCLTSDEHVSSENGLTSGDRETEDNTYSQTACCQSKRTRSHSILRKNSMPLRSSDRSDSPVLVHTKKI